MNGAPTLEVRGLHKGFAVRRWSGWRLQTTRLQAVADVSLALSAGESLALIGESGSGKSTLARCVVGLTAADSGRILVDGVDLDCLSPEQKKARHLQVQMVFQDASQALNPRFTAARSVEEALSAAGASQSELPTRRASLLAEVGFPLDLADRYPHQLSGGQKQRVSLARALACSPKVLILDEPVAGLDASLKAQVLVALDARRRRDKAAHLLISHDLSAAAFADRVAVMYLGRLLETGPAAEVLNAPRHPYTEALLASRPSWGPDAREWRPMKGEIPSPLHPPAGCVFHPRCQLATDRCQREVPEGSSDPGERRADCFYPLDGPAPSQESRP